MIDISTIGYKWKGIYSSALTYAEGDVVYKNGGAYVMKNNVLTPFSLGQQDATASGQVLLGQGYADGKYNAVLHSKGTTGVEFRYMDGRNATIVTALPHQTFMDSNAMGCGSDMSVSALMNDGSVRAWGSRLSGQLGDGWSADNWITKPTRVGFPPGTRIVSIIKARRENYYIDSNGQLWHHGENYGYAAGNGTAVVTIPQLMNGRGDIPVNAKIVRVQVGITEYGAVSGDYAQFGCVDDQGRVYVWGTNRYYSLGLSTNATQTTPTLIPLTTTVPMKDIFMSGGDNQVTWLLSKTGTLYTSGEQNSTALGYQPNVHTIYDVFQGRPVKKVFQCESRVQMGSSDDGVYRTYGILLEDGSLYRWGANTTNSMGTGVTVGSIYPSNANNSYMPYKVMDGVVDCYVGSAAYDRCWILKSDGTVWWAGWGDYGSRGSSTVTSSSTFVQLDPTYLSNVVKLRAYTMSYWGNAIVAMRSDGKVVTWGNNYTGWQGRGKAFAQNTRGSQAYDLGFVLLDKKIVDFYHSGYPWYHSVRSGTSPNYTYTYYTDSYEAMHFLTSDGQVYSTGYGDHGQVGDDENNDRYVPNLITF